MTDNLSVDSQGSSIQAGPTKVCASTDSSTVNQSSKFLIAGNGEEEGTCNAVLLARNGSDLSYDISSAADPDGDEDGLEDGEEEIILNVSSNVGRADNRVSPASKILAGATRGIMATGLSFESNSLGGEGDDEAEEYYVGEDADDDLLHSSSLPHLQDESPTIENVAKWIQDGRCKRIVVLSGAGVSCSAGIPDFRTPGTGLYDNLEAYGLPYPEAVFDVSFYAVNPMPFVSLASEIWPGLTYSPTLTHSFIALLASKNLLVRNYTQNIDGLENLAGVPENDLVECHGHFRTASCINCGIPFDAKECRTKMVEEKEPPDCPKCSKGLIKPDIVFFGESLPVRFGKCLHNDLTYCDLLIVMGTSLKVAPVSLIPEMVSTRCPRVLFNRELVGDFVPPGVDGNFRDVFVEGDCDENIVELCRLLGWEEELRELNASSKIGE